MKPTSTFQQYKGSRGRAVRALELWGHKARRLHCVSRSHAEVWRVELDHRAGAGGMDLALRLYPTETGLDAALDAEVGLLLAAADEGLHVPRPCAAPDGRWRIPLDVEGSQAMLLHWLPGRLMWAGLRSLHMRRVGVFIARLHGVAAQLICAGHGPSRMAFAPDLEALAQGAARLRALGGVALEHAVMRAAADLGEQAGRWPRDDAHWGWIHGDLHPWNLLFLRGQAGAIDFGDAGWGPLAHDLAAVLQFIRDPLDGTVDHRRQLPALRQALFEGYASVRPWPSDWPEQVDALHRLRLLTTLQWMLEDWSGPAERCWGPGFLQKLPRRLLSITPGG